MSTLTTTSVEWFKVAELARRWRVSDQAVYDLLFVPKTPGEAVPAGKVLATRVGGQYRIHADVVQAFERTGRIEQPTTASVAEIRKAMRVARKRALMSADVPDYLGDLES